MIRAQLALLLIVTLIAGATSREMSGELEASLFAHRSLLNSKEVATEAIERQRILAELEEVHQLRERMLQEGTVAVL